MPERQALSDQETRPQFWIAYDTRPMGYSPIIVNEEWRAESFRSDAAWRVEGPFLPTAERDRLRAENERLRSENASLRRQMAAADVPCGCKRTCGDDGDIDGPGTCKDLPVVREPLVELITVRRSPLAFDEEDSSHA